ncbi:TVP38/TMEM64 family protein [Fulvivirga ligni]|uniref:TVP38/TMEM64 family protein n=1 Tax=Fulvivirga ligni TaxID=2904246 RepID=UPI001F27F525|nr:TVP38/TMEM64 family protein [Fulvivirga ligni]UII19360.1 TVP38/TMEM64 family protein [Fulvivirga ligni]
MAKKDSGPVKKSKLPLIISIGLVAAVVCCYFFIPSVNEFFKEAWDVLLSEDKERTRQWVDQFGAFGPIVIIITMILQMFLLVIPSPLLMVVSVLAYGPWWGSLLILGAVFCASSIGYWIGSYLGPPVVAKILGQKSEKKVESFIDDYGFWAVIVTRISPFLSNDAVSFVGGILGMGYWKFIGATLLGITPLTIFIAYLGENSDRLKTGMIWASVVSLVMFLAYVWWDKKRKKKKSED